MLDLSISLPRQSLASSEGFPLALWRYPSGIVGSSDFMVSLLWTLVRLWEANELRGIVSFLVCHTLNLSMKTPLSYIYIIYIFHNQETYSLTSSSHIILFIFERMIENFIKLT